MPNKTLGDAAIHGVTDPAYESKPGYCERFNRQVNESVYGNKYSAHFEDTAANTARSFRDGNHDGYETFNGTPPDGYEDGDTIFKFEDTDPPSGHVGIFCDGAVKIAENSVTDIGRVQGAKGYRTPPQWPISACRVTVRFPDPNAVPERALILCKPDTCEAGGWKYTRIPSGEYDAKAMRWSANDSQVASVWGCAGVAKIVPLRDSLATLGKAVVNVVHEETHADGTVDPRDYVYTD